MYSFPNFEPVCCCMSSSNYCFLSCIQVTGFSEDNIHITKYKVNVTDTGIWLMLSEKELDHRKH